MTTEHKPITYGATNVRRRKVDDKYNVYVVLNYSDVGLASADDALACTMHHIPWLNPLKWVLVAVANNFELAKKEAARWRGELANGSRPKCRGDLITH